MHRVVKARSNAIFPVVQDILEDGGKAVIIVTGGSMMPFLRENVDRVELSKAEYSQISRGDIVLILRDNGAYVLHRVIKKDESSFFMVGDNQQSIEGPLRPDQIIATATAVYRRDKRIDCRNFLLKSLVNIWLALLPYRLNIKKVFCFPYKVMRKVLGKLKHWMGK